MTKLMNDTQINAHYTRADLIELIEAKSAIFNKELPKGLKRMKKAALIQTIRELDKLTQTPARTIKLDKHAAEKARQWGELQRFLQANDRNGDWLNMPPTLDNIMHVIEVLQAWEDVTGQKAYLSELNGMESKVHFCEECGNMTFAGYIFEESGDVYCSDACLMEVISMDDYLVRYDDGAGDVYWTDWRDA